MSNVILGIGLMLASTTLMNIGMVIQKKAIDSLPPLEQQTVGKNVKGVVTSKLWILGWVMTTLAMVFNFLALGQADISIIQPLIGFGLVVLVVFSHYYLGESVSKREQIGIIIALVGVIIIGITSAEDSRIYTDPAEILNSYLQPGAWIILILFAVCIAILWISAIKFRYRGAGIAFALIAALFSVAGVTFSKGLFSILDLIGFGSTLGMWQSWILLILLVTCSTMALATQQMSFQKGKSVVVTPVFNLCSIILPLSTGLLVFSETVGTGKIIATIFILVGAALLSWKSTVKATEIK